nr:uncharacterized protein LOC128680635 isoform X2 [Plodia interpunctella]
MNRKEVLSEMIYNIEMFKIEHRKKRSHSDNFNVLLGLYKISPLKNSYIYKKFSNHVLLPTRTADIVHYESHESSIENRTRLGLNLKHIENIIHATASPKNITSGQYYSVENKGPEFFTNAMQPSYTLEIPSQGSDDQFNNIFDHISSNDVETVNTKLVPVNVTLPKENIINKNKNIIKNDTVDELDLIFSKIDSKKDVAKSKGNKIDILETMNINKDLNDIDEDAVIVFR